MLFKKNNLYRKYNIYLLHLYPFYRKVKIVLSDFSFYIYGIKIFKNYGLGKDYLRNLCHEPICSKYLVDYFKMKPKAVFWDCGSSIGYYSVLAKCASRNKTIVHAFEKTILFNKYVNKSIKEFTDGNFFLINTILHNEHKLNYTILDEYAEKHGLPDIIKMDIDGSEVHALEGMKKIFEKSKPHFLIEVHFKLKYQIIRDFLQNLIPEKKYNLSLCINHRFRNAKWLPILSLSELPIKHYSYFPDPDYILLCEPAGYDSYITKDNQ